MPICFLPHDVEISRSTAALDEKASAATFAIIVEGVPVLTEPFQGNKVDIVLGANLTVKVTEGVLFTSTILLFTATTLLV